MPESSRIYAPYELDPYCRDHSDISCDPCEIAAEETADAPPAPPKPAPSESKGVTIETAIAKLDRVDGFSDGYYTSLPLHIENTTGLCEMVQMVKEELGNVAKIKQEFHAMCGKVIEVDCDVLAKRLTVLADIAARIPTFSVLPPNPNMDRSERLYALRSLSFEDMLGYHMVDHMISALLMGVGTTDKAPHVLFTEVEFANYCAGIDVMGQQLGNNSWQSRTVTDVREAYGIFRGLGKKYGFNTRTFRPR